MNKNMSNPKSDWVYYKQSKKLPKLTTKERIFLASFRVSTVRPGEFVKANPKMLE